MADGGAKLLTQRTGQPFSEETLRLIGDLEN